MSYQQPTAPITLVAPKSGGDDRTMWALVAVVLVLLAGGAGWVVAANQSPSWNDVEASARLAEREGAVAGRDRGFNRGAKVGRREARAQARLSALQGGQQSYTRGWREGFRQGRDQARTRRGAFVYDPAAAYPADSFDDLGYGDDSLLDDYTALGGNTIDNTYAAPGGGSLSSWYRGGSSAGY